MRHGSRGDFQRPCGAQVTLTDGVYDPLILVHLSTWSVRDRCKVERLRFGVDTLSKKISLLSLEVTSPTYDSCGLNSWSA